MFERRHLCSCKTTSGSSSKLTYKHIHHAQQVHQAMCNCTRMPKQPCTAIKGILSGVCNSQPKLVLQQNLEFKLQASQIWCTCRTCTADDIFAGALSIRQQAKVAFTQSQKESPCQTCRFVVSKPADYWQGHYVEAHQSRCSSESRPGLSVSRIM